MILGSAVSRNQRLAVDAVQGLGIVPTMRETERHARARSKSEHE